MRQRSVFRGHRSTRLVGHRLFGFIVYEIVVLLLATSLVWAREDPKQEAKARYSTGQSHYNLNEFQEALQEFKEAYRLFPDPAFLFNAAQCERQLGHQEEAIQFYRSYLRNAPKAPNRQEVEHRIDELLAALEAKKSAAPAVAVEPPAPAPAASPPASPPPVVPPPATSAPVEATSAPVEATSAPVKAAAEPVAEVTAPAAPTASIVTVEPMTSESVEPRADLISKPENPASSGEPAFYQRWWFWTGVAVVATGIGVGAYMISAGGGNQAPSSQLGTQNVF